MPSVPVFTVYCLVLREYWSAAVVLCVVPGGRAALLLWLRNSYNCSLYVECAASGGGFMMNRPAS